MRMIMSVDENWALGSNNRLLFVIPDDLSFFKETTTGGLVIMGRKTWESLPGGKPLPMRKNIVLSKTLVDEALSEQGVVICDGLVSLAQAICGLSVDTDKLWVIGGGEIYTLLAPYCREALVTKVLAEGSAADCLMENLDESRDWEQSVRGDLREHKELRYRYDRYQNIKIRSLCDDYL